jgi:tetratricopeptide (TPR) repeat protein
MGKAELRKKIKQLDSLPHREAHLIVLLASYVERHVDDVPIAARYGNALRAVGRFREAVRVYTLALEHAKKPAAQFNLMMGVALARSNAAPAEAEEWFAKALELDTHEPGWAWVLRGANLAILERFDKAIECYALALKSKDTDREEALQNIARVYRAVGDYETAAAYFTRASAVSPWDKELKLLKTGLEELARKSETAPLDRDALRARVTELEELADGAPRIIHLLADYVRKNPEDVRLVSDYANALRVVGRTREAILLFKQALEHAPGPAARFTLTSRIALCLELTAPDEAEVWYAKACEINEDSPAWVWVFRGNNLAKLERFDAAIDCYGNALKAKDVDRAEVFQQLALAYRALGDYDTAVTYLARAIAVAPSDKNLKELKEGLEGLESTREFAKRLEES